jgi:UDP-N-acetylglucosamine 2-epimerase
VGNSSAGIKECSYLGIPVVNIGKRQNNRLSSENVVHVRHDKEEIKKAINNQIDKKKYPMSDIYYLPGTGKNIAEKLATIDLYIQKSFRD